MTPRYLPSECYPPMTWPMIIHAAKVEIETTELLASPQMFTESLFTKVTDQIKRGEK